MVTKKYICSQNAARAEKKRLEKKKGILFLFLSMYIQFVTTKQHTTFIIDPISICYLLLRFLLFCFVLSVLS